MFAGFHVKLNKNKKNKMKEIKKLNCEIENGDNKFNRYEDFISLKNKINEIVFDLREMKSFIKELKGDPNEN